MHTLPPTVNKLDLVELITAMHLTVGGGDPVATRHRVREQMGVEEDRLGQEPGKCEQRPSSKHE